MPDLRAESWDMWSPSQWTVQRNRDRNQEEIMFMDEIINAGGCAGMCVDLTLFPLDTIKTRLQSQQGFYKTGGFRGIYAGVPSAAIGSFPNAAAFFVTYESTKSFFAGYTASSLAPITHMLAASLGEIIRATDDPLFSHQLAK
ncbi:S-adenosylmethionine mitochondrial carrier protein [Anabarilius grahami]|uniref:Mitochondrial S-adenosylmethionine carrier protein n=1 Tax=Anabarilius grahami TaxID=495550 RepID=A0A3N0XPB2_ANAGA|nr:S-adenosylmethionine mitochondrial carrier protein [Anabarilius grahami]